jgi:hypothetical protein
LERKIRTSFGKEDKDKDKGRKCKTEAESARQKQILRLTAKDDN